ncbi:MAG: serine hydrolase [Actinomycetota bacterium]|nr:serine hydrolase [Actinomycetota bacterium]
MDLDRGSGRRFGRSFAVRTLSFPLRAAMCDVQGTELVPRHLVLSPGIRIRYRQAHRAAGEEATNVSERCPWTAAREAGPTDPATDAISRSLPATSDGGRETFLDVVRAIAIVRVIAWHAFGVAAITYVVAAIPAMFFVTGSLLAKSLRRRPARTVLADRFRRLLVPLWVFGILAWLVMALAAWQTGTRLPLHRVLAWIFPLSDPSGSQWEGGWLSSHLWYLRTVTWLLLASPLLLRAVRANARLALLVAVVAVFGLDALSRGVGTGLPVNHRTIWGVGDLALYSVFLMLGFLHRDGALGAVTRRGWVAVALVAGLAAATWRLTQPVPLGVVNNSHPLHLFVGAAWLAAALAAQQTLARLGTSGVTGRLVRAIGSRALTIYLWHTAAIIVAINVLEAGHVEGGLAHPLALVVLTALGIVLAVYLFGWIEDVAARRGAELARRPMLLLRPVLALATVVAVAGAVLVSTTVDGGRVSEASASARSARRPPIPSQPPPAPKFEVKGRGPAPERPAVASEEKFVSQLDQLLQEWAGRTGVEGALVGVAGPTLRWSSAVGRRPDTGSQVSVSDRIELASLTKLFTAALVHRFADEGRIELSAPLPLIRVLPDFPYNAGITVEQLLSHRSGLVNYLDTDQYANDADSIDGPVPAVMASVTEPLAAAPGTANLYSSTNYLVLGLLLEEVAGRPLSDLLRDLLLSPLGLRDTVHHASAPAWPRGGTSGIETSLGDLMAAGLAILRDHVGLSDAAYALMTAVDVNSGFGPGSFGFCPCRVDSEGTPRFFAIGYYGATTLLAYAPSLDLTIAVDLVDSLGHRGGYSAVFTLFEMIEELRYSS